MKRWVDRSIRTKGFTAVGIPVVVLFVFVGSTFWAGSVNLNAEQGLASAEQLVATTSKLQTNLTELQINAAAYLLLGTHAYLAAYDQADHMLPDEFVALTSLTPQSGTLAALANRTENDALATFGSTANLIRLAKGSPAARVGNVQKELRSSTRLKNDVDQLTQLEHALIASDQAHAASSRDVVVGIAIAALAAVVGAALIAWRFFTVGIVSRLENIGRAAESLERGPIDGVPHGADEIGQLGRRLNRAANQLLLRQHERDRAQALLEDLLTASPVVSLRFDPTREGRLAYASPNLGHLFGIDADVASLDEGQLFERIHPTDLQSLRLVLRSGALHEFERKEMILRLRRDPTRPEWTVTAEAVVTLVPDARGGAGGVVVYLVDVTERQQARQAAAARLDLVESIFDASPDIITVRDAAGRVLLASGHGVAAIGTDGDDPEGRRVELGAHFRSITASDRARLDRLLTRSAAGMPTEPLRVRGLDAPGHPSVYEVRARPVVNGAGVITGTVTVSRDVTEQIHLEESLRSASADARQANEAKSEFLSRMSHELRTPLNAILGFTQLLELDDRSEQESANIRHIYRAGEHLLSLINEVLDISRIESGRLNLSEEPVAIGPAIDEVTALLAPIAQNSGIGLTADTRTAPGDHVRADRQRLLQVLFNLGSNAIKYNSKDGHTVFRTVPVGGDRVRFSVTDTGLGIPPELRSELFIPFSRLGAERSGIEGTGVGLALSKHLVELMGGSIGVDSTPGAGSTFWIELDRAEAPALPDDEAATDPDSPSWTDGLDDLLQAGHLGTTPRNGSTNGAGAGGGDFVIVYVEDNPSNAALVEQVLSRRPGVRLHLATCGRMGVESIRHHRPNLVLLDLHLPDLPGEEVLRQVKADPELADTRVVILSADATIDNVRRIQAQGIIDYLTKPLEVDRLLTLVDREMAVREVPT